ncbi:TPA: hypothetical protein H2C15_002586 [Salmonella enterica]|nr:hypothetical protein [Salmonella enterica]
MFMLLLSGRRYDPETFITVKQVYGTTLRRAGMSVPVRALYGDIASTGNTLSIPVRAAGGALLDSGVDLQKPVKNVHGYLLVTEA